MEVLKKFGIIFILVVSISIICINKVYAADTFDDTGIQSNLGTLESKMVLEETDQSVSTIKKVAGKILTVIQIASGVATVFVIIFTGYNYIVGTAEMKRDELKKMLPIIIGLALVTLTATIFNTLLNIKVQYS